MMKKMLWKILIVSLSLVFVSTIGLAAEKASPVPSEVKTVEKKAEAAAKAELLDINTVSKETLTKLPGIGDVYAKKIIDGRPYLKKDQLKSKKIIPADVYEKIKDKIIAKQPPKKK
ncbi:MAG TPA: helix-hairpin-helix domain-containing protein [Syntrophales bacterium]|nr:helix-hairpin-helix domain-containing protein [Syntrophales bacterium]